jgi:hypothetical protein
MHYLALGLTLALTGLGEAAIVAYWNEDIPIQTTLGGTSVNLETGAFGFTDDLPGADVNFFFGGTVLSNDADSGLGTPTFQPIRTGTGSADTLSNRGLGSLVDGSNTYGSGFGGSFDHIGDTFTAGTPGYIGFSLETGTGTKYGWMEVTLNPNTAAGTIHSWAFQDDGTAIAVGVPEPSTALLGLLGIGALALRRKR